MSKELAFWQAAQTELYTTQAVHEMSKRESALHAAFLLRKVAKCHHAGISNESSSILITKICWLLSRRRAARLAN